MTTTPVYGCRYCGVEAEHHGTRYQHRTGLHQWQGPTVEQVEDRQGITLLNGPWGGPVRALTWTAKTSVPVVPRNREEWRRLGRAQKRGSL